MAERVVMRRKAKSALGSCAIRSSVDLKDEGISVPNVCSEHLFRTSVFPMCLALVEVFGYFRHQIRIQHVALYHIDPWKHRKYSQNSQKQ